MNTHQTEIKAAFGANQLLGNIYSKLELTMFAE